MSKSPMPEPARQIEQKCKWKLDNVVCFDEPPGERRQTWGKLQAREPEQTAHQTNRRNGLHIHHQKRHSSPQALMVSGKGRYGGPHLSLLLFFQAYAPKLPQERMHIKERRWVLHTPSCCPESDSIREHGLFATEQEAPPFHSLRSAPGCLAMAACTCFTSGQAHAAHHNVV